MLTTESECAVGNQIIQTHTKIKKHILWRLSGSIATNWPKQRGGEFQQLRRDTKTHFLWQAFYRLFLKTSICYRPPKRILIPSVNKHELKLCLLISNII